MYNDCSDTIPLLFFLVVCFSSLFFWFVARLFFITFDIMKLLVTLFRWTVCVIHSFDSIVFSLVMMKKIINTDNKKVIMRLWRESFNLIKKYAQNPIKANSRIWGHKNGCYLISFSNWFIFDAGENDVVCIPCINVHFHYGITFCLFK